MLGLTSSLLKRKRTAFGLCCGLMRLEMFSLSSGSGSTLSGINSRVAGQFALVTGSTSGIGLEIAKDLASRGCNVVITGFGNVEKAIMEVEKVKMKEVKMYYIESDLTKEDQVLKLYEESCKQLENKINILINNAGFQYVSPIHEFPLEIYYKMMNVMVHTPFVLMKYVLSGIVEKHKWGRIINIASTHGLVASPNKSAYVTAKHGIVGMTKSVGLELCQSLFQNIDCTCNVICPGWVETELVQKQIYARMEISKTNYQQESFALVSEKMPKGQFVQPNHISAMVNYLCQDHASVINGAVIPIDGCWTAL